MKMRIKAKSKGEYTEVKVIMKHPMLTYREAKKKGKEANFITYVTAKVENDKVLEVSTSQFLSKNPYIKFKFKGDAKGKEIEITWVDLKGNTKTGKAKIK
jgi:sulfur-oxidizing protein SoxZ